MVIRRFYVTLIRPKLEYCSTAWCGAVTGDLRHLESLQVQVARAISRVRAPTEALRKANLPTLCWRRREHCLTMLWKLAHGGGPPMLRDLLPLPAHSRSKWELRFGHSFEFPRSSTARHLSSFLCCAIPIWNSLSRELVASSSVLSFRSALRRHFVNDMFVYGL